MKRVDIATIEAAGRDREFSRSRGDDPAAILAAEFLIVSDNSIAGRIHDATTQWIDRSVRAGTAAETFSESATDATASLATSSDLSAL